MLRPTVRALIGLALAVTLVAGCTDGAWKGCRARNPAYADWLEPGLFGRFPAEGLRGAYEFERVPAATGFDVSSPHLDGVYAPGAYALDRVQWYPCREEGNGCRGYDVRFELKDGRSFTAWRDADVNGSRFERLVHQALRNLTLANATELDALAKGLLENRTRAGETDLHRLRLDTPLRLESLFDGLWPRRTNHSLVPAMLDGYATQFYAGGWHWSFVLEKRYAHRADLAKWVSFLSVDALDQAHHRFDVPTPPASPDEAKRITRETFDRLGLGTPIFEGLRVRNATACR